MIELNKEDRDRLAAFDVECKTLHEMIGHNRDVYLTRERTLMEQLEALQAERATYMNILGRSYLSGSDGGNWEFNPELMAFAVKE